MVLSPVGFLFLGLLALIICLPMALVVVGCVKMRRSGGRNGRWVLGMGISWGLVLVALVAWGIFTIGPWRTGIVTRGKSPEGREYCVVQTFNGWVEPFQVSFYIRDAAGLWRWNYLEHEDNGWRSAEVTFSGGMAHVSRNGKPFSDIPLPVGTVDVAKLSADERDRHLDAGFSVEDVLRYHNQRCR